MRALRLYSSAYCVARMSCLEESHQYDNTVAIAAKSTFNTIAISAIVSHLPVS